MNSLQDILGSRDFTPPTEIEMIQDFVLRRYKSKCRVQVQQNAIVLIVSNSALASTIRLEQQRLIEACKLNKRLVIRTA